MPRHVKGLELANVNVNFSADDLRPAASFADVRELEIDNFKPQVSPDVPAAVFADDVTGVTIRNSPALMERK